jgi:uncharacterized repeat protein (TIGR03843 family)
LSSTRPERDAADLSREDQLRLLRQGTLDLEGRLIDASNTTLRAEITLDDIRARCVYKPIRGERPLWDFPDGTLAGREVAAYEVSAATGWDIVPPTVLRDGPLGEGACQLWIEEPDEFLPMVGFVPATEIPPGWLRVAGARHDDGTAYLLAHADDPALARMALFDIVINNADRKGGHVLHPPDGHLYGVDHGVCFHVDDKLRTVLWGWAGKPVPAAALSTLEELREDLAGPLGERLCGLISDVEVDATRARLDRLIARRRFPKPSSERYVMPWPPI